jgi:hypothetical protein
MTSITLAWNGVAMYLVCDRHVQECNISSRHLYENPTVQGHSLGAFRARIMRDASDQDPMDNHI